MRIAELEEELDEGTDTDSVENGGVSDGSASTGAVDPVPPVDTVLSGRTDDALTAVETLVTLHIEALHATRDERVPMMIRTSKACAGPVTVRKQGVNAPNDIDSHQRSWKGGGGQIPIAGRPKDRRLAFLHIAAG